MKIILASASPRRKEILEKQGYIIDIVPSLYDEKINGLKYSDNLVENCAFQKALEVKNRVGNKELIVAADTVVVDNEIILGKPRNKDEAISMLSSLSDKTHFVATAICLICNETIIKKVEKTFVTFRKLSYEDIEKYIEKSRPFDKAGSYGIQDYGFDFAINIKGELDNVIGFPVKLFNECLENI